VLFFLSVGLRLVTPPTTELILPVVTVRDRLGLAPSDDTALTPYVEEASALLAVALRYSPAYAQWEEDIGRTTRDTVYLSARPVWSPIVSLLAPGGNSVEAGLFDVDFTRSLVRAIYGNWTWSGSPMIALSGNGDSWYVIRYWAGWWLESMTGSPPAGVGRFPTSLRRAFLSIVRSLWTSDKLSATLPPGIASMSKAGLSVTFAARDESASIMSLLPPDAQAIVNAYRRVSL
jgi:hypothetical protein